MQSDLIVRSCVLGIPFARHPFVRLSNIEEIFTKVMLADVYLSAFLLAYEFLFIWAVQHFDDYDMYEILFFVSFITSKIVLNLTSSYAYATKIGWQFSTRVVESTRWFRIVHR